MSDPVLEVSDLHVTFRARANAVRAVRGVSFQLERGRTLGIVGESGSGKSVLARAVLGLSVRRPGVAHTGAILLDGLSVLDASDRELRHLRGSAVSMIFQDPMRSLNPTMRIGAQLTEMIRTKLGKSRSEADALAVSLLGDVRIPNPEARARQYPHELSGGMRQRVMIAMAISCEPLLLIADEPTTALDVTVQAQILQLLRELQEERGMSIVLVTHDLGVAAIHTDEIAVMYAGQIVEHAATTSLFDNMRMPYTKGLFDSIPRLRSRAEQSALQAIPGRPPKPSEVTSGCAFEPRCPYSSSVCVDKVPKLSDGGDRHLFACHHPLGAPEGGSR